MFPKEADNEAPLQYAQYALCCSSSSLSLSLSLLIYLTNDVTDYMYTLVIIISNSSSLIIISGILFHSFLFLLTLSNPYSSFIDLQSFFIFLYFSHLSC
jgi:hypothetical protein